MLVVLHSIQLEAILRQSIVDQMNIVPDGLSIDPRFLIRSQDNWVVTGEMEAKGEQHDVRFLIDPASGKVRNIEIPSWRPPIVGGS
jgi:hypothetical protein